MDETFDPVTGRLLSRRHVTQDGELHTVRETSRAQRLSVAGDFAGRHDEALGRLLASVSPDLLERHRTGTATKAEMKALTAASTIRDSHFRGRGIFPEWQIVPPPLPKDDSGMPLWTPM